MIYKKNMNDFKKRLYSFIWRGIMMSLAFFIEYLASNLGDLQLSNEVVVVIGLILGEISKQIYNIYRK